MTHPNRPSERSPVHCPLDAATFRAMGEQEQRREAEYQRYLALRATPEYQALLAAALARHGVKS